MAVNYALLTFQKIVYFSGEPAYVRSTLIQYRGGTAVRNESGLANQNVTRVLIRGPS